MATGSQELSCDLHERLFPRIRTVLRGPDYLNLYHRLQGRRAQGKAGTPWGCGIMVALLVLMPCCAGQALALAEAETRVKAEDTSPP